jgi:hypothetical protein
MPGRAEGFFASIITSSKLPAAEFPMTSILAFQILFKHSDFKLPDYLNIGHGTLDI